jgi:hypothetical protein
MTQEIATIDIGGSKTRIAVFTPNFEPKNYSILQTEKLTSSTVNNELSNLMKSPALGVMKLCIAHPFSHMEHETKLHYRDYQLSGVYTENILSNIKKTYKKASILNDAEATLMFFFATKREELKKSKFKNGITLAVNIGTGVGAAIGLTNGKIISNIEIGHIHNTAVGGTLDEALRLPKTESEIKIGAKSILKEIGKIYCHTKFQNIFLTGKIVQKHREIFSQVKVIEGIKNQYPFPFPHPVVHIDDGKVDHDYINIIGMAAHFYKRHLPNNVFAAGFRRTCDEFSSPIR